MANPRPSRAPREVIAGSGIISGTPEGLILANEYDVAWLTEGKSKQEAEQIAIAATRAIMGQGPEAVRAAHDLWLSNQTPGTRPQPTRFRSAASPTAHARTSSASRDRNPLIAAAYVNNHDLASRAARLSPEPTLFAAGDLPDFTASGIDPKVLLQVPWNARPTLAAEPSKSKVFAAVEQFNGVEDLHEAELVAIDYDLVSPAVAEYQRRVNAWLAAAMTEQEAMVHLGFASPDTLGGAGHTTGPTAAAAPGSDDEIFQRLGW